MDSAGWDAAQLALFSFHIMGTARMGGSPRTSATNPEAKPGKFAPLCNGRVRLPQRVGRKPYDFHRGDSAPQRLGLSVAIASSIELVILPANRPGGVGPSRLVSFLPIALISQSRIGTITHPSPVFTVICELTRLGPRPATFDRAMPNIRRHITHYQRSL